MTCQHNKVLIVTRYYPGTYYDPPETDILHCECKECDEDIDYSDRAENAEVEEIDYRDYFHGKL